MDVDIVLLAEVLQRHQIEDVGRRVGSGLSEFRCECVCGGWRSDPFLLGDLDAGDAAKVAGLLHQAERQLEAIRLRAQQAPDAEAATTVEAPDRPVPDAVEAM